MSELTPFQLSRVYAAGWNTGMSCAADEDADALAARGEALNPHDAPAARARWTQGFSDAIERKLTSGSGARGSDTRRKEPK
jgi:hypothetical protein